MPDIAVITVSLLVNNTMQITLSGSKYTIYYFKGKELIGINSFINGKWLIKLI